jgi:hypothetical protein
MSSRSHRREVRSWQKAQRRARALTTPRHFRDDICLPGIGSLVVRIAVLPSFERTEVWEIRRAPDASEARLFVARSAEPGDRHVVGYAAVAVGHADLERAIGALRSSFARAGAPDEVDVVILDGVWFEVSFHSFIVTHPATAGLR